MKTCSQCGRPLRDRDATCPNCKTKTGAAISSQAIPKRHPRDGGMRTGKK